MTVMPEISVCVCGIDIYTYLTEFIELNSFNPICPYPLQNEPVINVTH